MMISWAEPAVMIATARIFLLTLIIFPLLFYVSRLMEAFIKEKVSAHVGMIVGKVIYYASIIFVVVSILHECGFNISLLMGAAGVVGIAVGFAAQTTIANMLSGLFLMLENTFFLGDIVSCGTIKGKVHSISLLSIQIKRSDNALIRVSYQDILQHPFINHTRLSSQRIALLLTCSTAIHLNSAKELIDTALFEHKKNNYLQKYTLFLHKIERDPSTQYHYYTFKLDIWTSQIAYEPAIDHIIQSLHTAFAAQNYSLQINGNY